MKPQLLLLASIVMSVIAAPIEIPDSEFQYRAMPKVRIYLATASQYYDHY